MLKFTTAIAFVLCTYCGIGSTQEAIVGELFVPRPCVSSCSGKFELNISTVTATVDRELQTNKDVQKQIQALESESSSLQNTIFKVKPCPCQSKCLQQANIIKTCGKCYIAWPCKLFDTSCSNHNLSCPLSCGCPGACQPYGPRYQKVLMFCPNSVGALTWVIKTITLCTNCCCQYRNPIG